MVKVTEKERTAAGAAAEEAGMSEFKTEGVEQQDADTLEIEELAAIYVTTARRVGETPDPRAIDVFNAAKEAGRIDADGNWIE